MDKLKIKPLIVQLISKPTSFFVCSALLFGIFFVLINPPGFGLDERAHFLRVYQISNISPLPQQIGQDKHFGALFPTNLVEFVSTSTRDLLDNNSAPNTFRRHDANSPAYSRYFKEQFSKDKSDEYVSNAQLAGTYAYNPISYTHFVFAFKIADLLNMSLLNTLYFVRFFSLITYIAIVYCAIRIAPKYKWLIVAIALLPTSVFQASTISIDPLINSLAFLVFALLMRIYARDKKSEKKHHLAGIVAVSVLALSKLPYVLLVIPFILLRKDYFSSKKQRYILTISWLLPLIIGLIWLDYNSETIKLSISTFSTIDPTTQLNGILHNPVRYIAVVIYTLFSAIDGYFASMVGWIGDRFIGLPISILVISFMSSILFALAQDLNPSSKITQQINNKKNGYAPLLSCVLIIAGIFTSLYLAFTPTNATIIAGIQGRYFIPLLPFLVYSLTSIFSEYFDSWHVNKPKHLILFPVYFLLISTASLYYIVNY